MEPTVPYLALRGDSFDIGFDAPSVLRVVAPADWSGPPRPALEALVTGAPNPPLRHVLVLANGGDDVAVGTARDLVMRECAASDVHELPSLLYVDPSRGLFRQVVAPASGSPLLVVDRDALARFLDSWT